MTELRAYMNERGLTSTRLAAVDLGVSAMTISNALTGKASQAAQESLCERIAAKRSAAPPELGATLLRLIGSLLAAAGHDVTEVHDDYKHDLCVDGICLQIKASRPEDGGRQFYARLVEQAAKVPVVVDIDPAEFAEIRDRYVWDSDKTTEGK